jgi:hypothetical protein
MGTVMLKRTCKSASLVMVLCVGVFATSGQTIGAEEFLEDPIAYTGHGMMFDQNGKRIEPTRQFIADAQRFYIGFLSKRLPDQQRHILKRKIDQLFAGAEFDEQDQLVANESLIDWQIQHLDHAHVDSLDQLEGKNNFLKWLSRHKPTPDDRARIHAETFTPSATLQQRLDLVELGNTTVRATTSSGVAYMDECRNAGVPIPPDWGSSQWQSKGLLSTDFIGSAVIPAEVFIAQSASPFGVSIALPRYTTSTMQTIDLLGIISLGKASGKACFWDNGENGGHFDIPTGTIVPLSQFTGGAALFGGTSDRCTACHAGENPFIMHPNTPLGLPNLAGLPLFADQWYQPLVHPNWPQNPGPLVGPSGPCTTCHTAGGEGGRFPDMSSLMAEYCGTVLLNALNRTMPPGNPAYGSLGNDADKAHGTALETVCKTPPAASIEEIMGSILLPLR